MYIRRTEVLASFDQMQKYLYLTKSALDEAKEEFFRSTKGMRSSRSEEEPNEEILRLLHEEYVEVNYQFPHLLYSSFLIAWYSFVEHNLIQLCDDLKLTVNIKIRERDDAGKGIQRAKKFLKEAAKYEIPEERWQELVMIRQLRNFIVHENGELISFTTKPVDEKTVPLDISGMSHYEHDPKMLYVRIDNKLLEYLEGNILLRYNEQLYLDLTFEYCLDLVNIGRGLFLEVWDGLQVE